MSITTPPAPEAGRRKPKRFIEHVRRRLTLRVMHAKHLKANAARAYVNHLSDEDILEQAVKTGIAVAAIGDGQFLDWLMEHLPDILKLIEALLPLILAFI